MSLNDPKRHRGLLILPAVTRLSSAIASKRRTQWQANALYWAVSAFGPNWKLERRIAQAPGRTPQMKTIKAPQAITAAFAMPAHVGSPRYLSALRQTPTTAITT